MITLSKKWNYCLAGLLAVLGLLIICLPALFVVLLGLGAIAYGVYNFLYTKKLYENTSFGTIVLIRCIVSVVIGLLAVFFPIAIGSAIWVVTLDILAVYLICTAGLGFYSMYMLKDSEIDFKNYLYENLALLVIAIVLFLIPGTVGNVFKTVVGGVCILVGVGIGLYTWYLNRDVTVIDISETETEPVADESSSEVKTEESVDESEKTEGKE